MLASAFAEECAHRMGLELGPLTPDCMRRLKAYDWPGNVRELANVIERAVITSRDRGLNLDRALPATDAAPPIKSAPEPAGHRVITMGELRDLERDNLVRALEASGWKVSGNGGAAGLLGMKPSTLTSRMKALGVRPEVIQRQQQGEARLLRPNACGRTALSLRCLRVQARMSPLGQLETFPALS